MGGTFSACYILLALRARKVPSEKIITPHPVSKVPPGRFLHYDVVITSQYRLRLCALYTGSYAEISLVFLLGWGAFG